MINYLSIIVFFFHKRYKVAFLKIFYSPIGLDYGLIWCKLRPIFAYKLTKWNIFKRNLQPFFKNAAVKCKNSISLVIEYENNLRHVRSKIREDITKGFVRKWWLVFF